MPAVVALPRLRRRTNFRSTEPIRHAANGTLAELHHIAGQRARLVRENVLNLAQILV